MWLRLMERWGKRLGRVTFVGYVIWGLLALLLLAGLYRLFD